MSLVTRVTFESSDGIPIFLMSMFKCISLCNSTALSNNCSKVYVLSYSLQSFNNCIAALHYHNLLNATSLGTCIHCISQLIYLYCFANAMELIKT